jgi:hypothetical protein
MQSDEKNMQIKAAAIKSACTQTHAAPIIKQAPLDPPMQFYSRWKGFDRSECCSRPFARNQALSFQLY